MIFNRGVIFLEFITSCIFVFFININDVSSQENNKNYCDSTIISNINFDNLPVKFLTKNITFLFQTKNCNYKILSYFSNYLIIENNFIVERNYFDNYYYHSNQKISEVSFKLINKRELFISFKILDINNKPKYFTEEYYVVGKNIENEKLQFEGMLFNSINSVRPIFWILESIIIPKKDLIHQCKIIKYQIKRELDGCALN